MDEDSGCKNNETQSLNSDLPLTLREKLLLQQLKLAQREGSTIKITTLQNQLRKLRNEALSLPRNEYDGTLSSALASIQNPAYFGTRDWYDKQTATAFYEYGEGEPRQWLLDRNSAAFHGRFKNALYGYKVPMYLRELSGGALIYAHCIYEEAEISNLAWEIIGDIGKSLANDQYGVIWDGDEPLGSPLRWYVTEK